MVKRIIKLMEVWSRFLKDFIKLVGSIVNNMERTKKKEKEHKQHGSMFKMLLR